MRCLNNPLARIRSGSWLDAQEFPPLQWAITGLVPEGYGLVIGPPKLGKSWFVLSLLISASSGSPALGSIPSAPRPTLYAALEDGDKRMQRRTRKLTQGAALPELFEYFTGPATSEDTFATIKAWLELHPEGFVVLDTLGKVMPPAGPGQGAYERDYQVGSHLKELADLHPGCTVLAVHHSRKMASNDFMDSTSGTNGINGSADFTIVLERQRNGDDAQIKLSGRDVEEGEYAAQMIDGVWTLQGGDLLEAAQKALADSQAQSLGEDSTRLLQFVISHPEGVRAGDVAKEFGWTEAKARLYLKRLFDSERITKLDRGLYVCVTTVTSVTIGVDTPDVNVTQDTEVTPLYRDADQWPNCFLCKHPKHIDTLTNGICAQCASKQGSAS